MDRIVEILKQHWGYEQFLPLQREAIASVVAGRDSVVVLPTGGGKSVCYQVPSVRLPGTAIVVSPLISLMKDQVDALIECGVAAACLHSNQTETERNDVIARLHAGELKVLYVSPERLMMEGFLRLLKRQALSFVAVDEAHCVSMWGHDFRPEYRQLGRLKEVFPDIAIHAYTATATRQVRDDIAAQLRLDRPEVLVGSFDRPNLIYSVERRIDVVRQVADVLDRHRNESSIVYCIRRADVDDLASRLRQAGYRVAPYHAGLTPQQRKGAQEAFIGEDVDTIVATVAFGMGIDKSNVRAVVHAGMPKSIEHYQQESGRAGRDGLDAECVLLYGAGDYGTWKYIIEQSDSDEARRIALSKLADISAYASGVTCRHGAILEYFGQQLERENCNACDVCFGDLELADDGLVLAQKILSCVYRLEERYGGDHTAAVLIGSRDQRILAAGHDGLSTYGLLAEHPKRLVRDWIEQLVGQGCLERRGEYNLLAITRRGWRVIRGEQTPRLLKPAERPRARAAAADSWDGVDRGLFETLRALRREIARQRGVPAYIVFGDAALRDMARRRPSGIERFLDVSGVGQSKARQYGERFVATIREHARSRGLELDVDPSVRPVPKPKQSRRRSRPTVDLARGIAYERYGRGASVSEVAATLEKRKAIALGYLLDYIRDRDLTSPEPWVEQTLFRRIAEAAKRTGVARPLKIVKELEGDADVDDVRIAIACLENVAQRGNGKPGRQSGVA